MTRSAGGLSHGVGPARWNARGGFTLIELLMAVFVSSLVFGGLAAISATAARTQGRDYRHGVVGSNVLFAQKVIEQNLARASANIAPEQPIVQPTLGATAATLCVRTCQSNCTSAYSTPTYSFVYFCRSTDNKLWMYASGGACPSPTPCGAGSPASMVAEFITVFQCTRPAGFINTVQVTVTGSLASVASGTTETLTTTGQFTTQGARGKL